MKRLFTREKRARGMRFLTGSPSPLYKSFPSSMPLGRAINPEPKYPVVFRQRGGHAHAPSSCGGREERGPARYGKSIMSGNKAPRLWPDGGGGNSE